MNKLLYWISGFLPCRYINDGNVRYLERYYLFTLLGWRFYLHQFVGSDPDRWLHCHPWKMAFSIILSGWYWEETVYGTRKVRWFNWLTGESKHRVVLPCSLDGFRDLGCAEHHGVDPCWTLFFHRAENAKTWGFYQSIDGHPEALLFVPYQYTREGNQRDWWLTAPTGKELRSVRVRKAGDA